MTSADDAQAIARLSVLEKPTRKAVYDAVRQAAPTNRAEVAEDVGISVSLAAFHLDKLLEASLLEAFYARPPGRGGPGAGRPAKWYQPSDVQLEVSIPARRYDLMATVLADAVDAAAESGDPQAAVAESAWQAGHQVGATAPPAQDRSSWRSAIEPLGYEPVDSDAGVVFRNCPFAALATHRAELVCRANAALIEGALDGSGARDVDVRLQPGAGGCCILLREEGR